MRNVQELKARYDEFIRYCDNQFQNLMVQLSKRQLLKNTIIILSADHGESFEHGAIQHSGLHLYEQVTHIPLIIKEPNQANGRIINDVVEQIDVPSTILDLANIPVPDWMEGHSLVPLMRGETIPVKPAFSMSLETNVSGRHKISKGTIAVWEGDYKLIRYLDYDKTFLFNLARDPHELNNLMDKEPERKKHLLSLILENFDKANKRILDGDKTG